MHGLDFILLLERVILCKVNNRDHHIFWKPLNAVFELLRLPPSDKIMLDKASYMALKEGYEIFATHLYVQKIFALLCVALFNILA